MGYDYSTEIDNKNADYGGNLPNRMCADLGGSWSGNTTNYTMTTDGYLRIKCKFTVPEPNDGG